jgi:hypothetical protein
MAHGRERSPQRASLDSIFAPLDPNERLPREQLIQASRNWTRQELGRGDNSNWTIWDLRFGRQLVAGVLWVPAVLIVLFLTMQVTSSPLVAFSAAGALLVAFWRLTFAHRSR